MNFDRPGFTTRSQPQTVLPDGVECPIAREYADGLSRFSQPYAQPAADRPRSDNGNAHPQPVFFGVAALSIPTLDRADALLAPSLAIILRAIFEASIVGPIFLVHKCAIK